MRHVEHVKIAQHEAQEAGAAEEPGENLYVRFRPLSREHSWFGLGVGICHKPCPEPSALCITQRDS